MRPLRFEIVVTLALVGCWAVGLGYVGLHLLGQGGFWCRYEPSEFLRVVSVLAYYGFYFLLWLTTAGVALGCWFGELGTTEARLCIGLALLHALVGATVGGLVRPCF